MFKVLLNECASKCIQKSPKSRFSSYAELENALTTVAKKRGFDLDRTQVYERYSRSTLGKGQQQQQHIRQVATSLDGEYSYGVIEFDEHYKFLEEAESLMSLGRFSDAEKLLRPYFIPEMLEDYKGPWHFGHSFALNYALCLENMSDKLQEALNVYHSLASLTNKPAEFFVNISNCLNKISDFGLSRKYCEEGLDEFTNDIDLLGNYTIALKQLGELDLALKNATRRLDLRRDVHSIEEIISVLASHRKKLRDTDLPTAIEFAKHENDLIVEGMSLNPRFLNYLLQKINLLRFAHAGGSASDICRVLIDDEDADPVYRQLAFAQMMNILVDYKKYQTVVEKIDSVDKNNLNESIYNDLILLKFSILADHYMIGIENDKGERVVIKQVVDYYLSTENGKYVDPLMAAKIYEWLGNTEKAIEVVTTHLGEAPEDWKAVKELALFYLRDSNDSDAMEQAGRLVQIAPWRAESYDWLGYIAKQTNRLEIERQCKEKGDNIFVKEDALFEEIRKHIKGN